MRYDIRVMWVEDMPKWYRDAKEIIEMYMEDEGLSANIEYIDEGQMLLDKLQCERDGFKLYDIFFIDYSLSNGVVGSSLIKELRKTNIDSDILFYSSENEKDIRKDIIDDLNSFEGVYIANRNNFREKSQYLIKKNAKKLLSLSNIRGLLTDQTSENDYIIISYLYKKYDGLSGTQKEEIKNTVLDYMISMQNKYESMNKKEIERIKNNGITNIKKLLSLPSDLIPLDLKYRIFGMILNFNGEKFFDGYTLENYFEKIVKKRNTVAHKKLDICRMQKNILYYDNINQFLDRKCPDNCQEHTGDKKISVSEWTDIRKLVIEYGKCFDNILEEIMQEVLTRDEVAASKQDT